MTVSAILFDKDGTLFDFAATWETWAQSFLLRLCAGDSAQAAEVGAAIGFEFERTRFRPDSICIAGTTAEIAEELAPRFPRMGVVALIALLNEEAAKAPQSQAVPLVPLLDGLRGRGYLLGVATNDAEAPARMHLSQAGILDRFDFIAGFDSGHGAKPAPGQLLAFARTVGLHPARVAMVGDSTHDLIAGRSAGMRTVGVLTGVAGSSELAPHADVVLPSIGHLNAWLGL